MRPLTERRGVVVLALGTTQTLAWALSYYLPAMLADPNARELGISGTVVFAAFSVALLLSALLGPAGAGSSTGAAAVACSAPPTWCLPPASRCSRRPMVS